jgi:hypothetical protein
MRAYKARRFTLIEECDQQNYKCWVCARHFPLCEGKRCKSANPYCTNERPTISFIHPSPKYLSSTTTAPTIPKSVSSSSSPSSSTHSTATAEIPSTPSSLSQVSPNQLIMMKVERDKEARDARYATRVDSLKSHQSLLPTRTISSNGEEDVRKQQEGESLKRNRSPYTSTTSSDEEEDDRKQERIARREQQVKKKHKAMVGPNEVGNGAEVPIIVISSDEEHACAATLATETTTTTATTTTTTSSVTNTTTMTCITSTYANRISVAAGNVASLTSSSTNITTASTTTTATTTARVGVGIPFCGADDAVCAGTPAWARAGHGFGLEPGAIAGYEGTYDGSASGSEDLGIDEYIHDAGHT